MWRSFGWPAGLVVSTVGYRLLGRGPCLGSQYTAVVYRQLRELTGLSLGPLDCERGAWWPGSMVRRLTDKTNHGIYRMGPIENPKMAATSTRLVNEISA